MSRGGSSNVEVEGEAGVVLVSGSTRYGVPGATVPPGRYDIEATFPGEDPVVVGKITVREGESHTISCNQRMGICRAR